MLVDFQIVDDKLCCMCNNNAHEFPQLKHSHFVTMMVLAWPYPSSQTQNKTHADFCLEYVAEEMKGIPKVLEHEVKLLNAQLSTIFMYYESINSSEVMLNRNGTGCKKIK